MLIVVLPRLLAAFSLFNLSNMAAHRGTPFFYQVTYVPDNAPCLWLTFRV
jgi:hypothetical protein